MSSSSLTTTAIQSGLTRIGTYAGAVDGQFGPMTALAVKRFQWNLRNVPYRIVDGHLEGRAHDTAIAVTGEVDERTAGALQSWAEADIVAAGNLVRVRVGDYPRLSDNTTAIDHPDLASGDLVVDAQFVAWLSVLDRQAAALSVSFQVNQSVRVAGAAVSGAVVQPAQRSQHLIGRAVDGNLVVDGQVVFSTAYRDRSAPDSANRFIALVKEKGMRWGGDFAVVDYVHFDDFIDPTSDEWTLRYFFNQRALSEKQPIPALTALVA